MNIWEIVKSVGAGVFSSVVPGGGLILQGVNEFLSDDKKLNENATVQDVGKAISDLPPEIKAQLEMKQFDVKIEELRQIGQSNRHMLEMEMQSKRTTRPFIAKWSFIFTAIFSGAVGGAVIIAYCYAVFKGNVELVKAVVDGWPFVLAVMTAVTGTFSLLLRAYFGILAKEQETKLAALTGVQRQGGMAQLVSAIRR